MIKLLSIALCVCVAINVAVASVPMLPMVGMYGRDGVQTQNATMFPWPDQFWAHFQVTKEARGVIGAPGTVFYSSKGYQRTDYPVQCSFGGDPTKPCTVQMNSVGSDLGIYLLTGAQRQECCVLFGDLGSFPSDWTQTLKFVKDSTAFGRPVQVFSDGGPAAHTFYVQPQNQSPIYMSPEEWHWLTGYIQQPVDPIFFELPPSCKQRTVCPGFGK
jgi:hypothetical protein